MTDHLYSKLPITLSSYAENLDNVAKERYIEKLRVLKPDGSIFYLQDPYFLKEIDWIDDLSRWPKITDKKIKEFLTNCPGLNKKSLEAFDFVTSGKVQKVLVHVPKPELKICTTKVMPSMRLSDKPYQPWVITQEDEIQSAHCNCIGGLGEVCSHVGALLYKIQFAVVAGITSACTEKKSEWNASFTKKITATALKNINFKKAKAGEVNNITAKLSTIQPCGAPATTAQIKKLRGICPDAVYFTIFSDSEDSEDDTETGSEGEDQSGDGSEDFLTMMAALESNVITSNAELIEAFKDVDFKRIEFLTRKQSESDLWKQQRCGRLTSSTFGSIIRRKKKDESFPAQFLSIRGPLQVSAVIWGKDHEKVALDAYKEEYESSHSNFRMASSGLIISDSDPYLGASPDAVVSCNCCGKGLVEVKCPYTDRNKTPAEIYSTDKKFYLDNNGNLKESHEYFSQVQGQMAIANVDYCDFVVWTLKGIHITRINRDSLYWETNKVILEKFFFEQVVPVFYKLNSN